MSEAATLVGDHLGHLGDDPLSVVVVVENVDGRETDRDAARRGRAPSSSVAAVGAVGRREVETGDERVVRHRRAVVDGAARRHPTRPGAVVGVVAGRNAHPAGPAEPLEVQVPAVETARVFRRRRPSLVGHRSSHCRCQGGQRRRSVAACPAAM